MRQTAGRALRVLIAAALFAGLLWYSRPADVGRALAGVAWPWVAGAVALVLIDRSLMAWRWIALLAPVSSGSRPPFAVLLRIFLVSTFLGTFLPGSVGGDAVRGWSLAKAGVAPRESFGSVLMDRLLGVISILLAALAGLLLAPDMLDERIVRAGLIATALACLVALAFVFSTAAANSGLRIVERAGAARVHGALRGLVTALQAYRGHRALLALVLAGSLGVQVIRIVQAWMLGQSLGITAGLAVYFAFVPVILLVMLLPITINGIGSSQAAFVWAFARAGVTPADAFALSVLFVALGTVGNMPGALLYAIGGARPAAAARVQHGGSPR